MKRWLLAPAVAALAAVLGFSGSANAAPAKWCPPAYSPPIRSGLPWASGIFDDSWTQSDYTAFGKWRGSKLDVAVSWPVRDHWEDFTEPNENYDSFAGSPWTMSFGIPPIPQDGTATLADCAAGKYKAHWETFARTMKSYHLDRSIIRLGWEFNGSWYVWGGDAEGFVGCWKQIVTTVRRIAPGLHFDWNVNRGSSDGLPGDEVLKAWPGDQYVDIVGIDSYDWWSTIDDQFNGAYGVNYWLKFAKAHGKKLSIPEWGVTPGNPNGNGDDPVYIKAMFDFFKKNHRDIAYESYFNWNGTDTAGSLYDPVQAPKASQMYKHLY
jgi:hypothetical protein